MSKQRRGQDGETGERRERGGLGGVKGLYLRHRRPEPSCLLPSPPLSTLHRQTSASSPHRMSLPNSENASTLENAMQLMIQTFHKYSGNEGDKYTLSRAELKELLTTELGTYLGNAQDKEAVDKVMKDLDSNNDGEVDFTEFVILVGALTVACNDFFLEFNDKPEKK
ncbi:S100 calcium binding protein T [Cyprinodon tularosa]|uniref:S100 calcium binding protein T n=3 Tax=Cyprinodontoidei TaxID=8087 RepID=A0A3Q2EJV9_CYPVA|nr:PREDICTED: protein S100-A1-like [Cyprinodon variegatus]XP_038146108.1 S100 calcium binding protein T [Cyprinodon tularosa]